MALSAEEKAQRKAVYKLRDKIHRQRTSAFFKQRDTAESEADARHRDAMTEADNERNRLLNERNDKIDAMKKQIAALEDAIKSTGDEYTPRIRAASDHYSDVNTARLTDINEAHNKVKEQFPDLFEREGALYSSAAWGQAGMGAKMVEEAL